MAPTVLTVLPDHPLPATTGLHLRMVANLEMVRRVAEHHHVLWFATEDRPPSRVEPIGGVSSTVCGGARQEQHLMSAGARATAKIGFAANGVVGRVGTKYPFSMRYDVIGAADTIARRVEEVGADWVLLPSQGMHWSAALPEGCRVVIDAADVLSAITGDLVATASNPVERLSLWANHIASRTQERKVLPLVDEIWVTSHREAEQMATLAPGANVVVVPNAIDGDAISPLRPSSGPRTGFLGTYSYLPNLAAVRLLADEIFPRVVATMPQAELLIAGAGLPDDDAARFATRPSLKVLGRVADLEAFWESLAVAALPVRLRGGVPLKLIEALARGRAVVASPELVAGLDLVDGTDIMVEQGPTAFADTIGALLGDDAARRQFEIHARRAFERNFSYDTAARSIAEASLLCR